MSAKGKSKQEEALQLLDDLESFTPLGKPADDGAPPSNPNEGEAEVLAFLDEITQKSAEPTRSTTSHHLERPASRSATPTLRKSTERVRLGGSALAGSTTPPALKPAAIADNPDTVTGQGGWGWGSVWSSASAAIQQAKTAVDEQVKHLPNNDVARKWGEGVYEYAKTAQLDKLGMYSLHHPKTTLTSVGQDFKRVGLTTLTDILNVVAPPIAEHEVIQVWLSHDMHGYDGVETLVYRSLARVGCIPHESYIQLILIMPDNGTSRRR